ncbi:phosphoglycerate dehydrogenase [Candidatus Roizmanbacteria bacterium]|nr:phosphoglycerate dehydrogenase [Candidatus Roizmanbacteria bacterium]
MKTQTYYIIDFDSTFIRGETLDLLATICLKSNPNRKKIIEEIEHLTVLGMEGKIPFSQSLEKRLQLIKPNKTHINKLISYLKKHISPSIVRNKEFFKQHKEHIYIVSGGFKECIIPLTRSFGIRPSHILANTFIFNKQGTYTGYDRTNPLAQAKGKIKAIQTLNLSGNVVVIGDGYTDFELKEMGAAKVFVAFTENVIRDAVVGQADQVAPSFDEFLYANKLPSSVSYPKNRIKILLLENIDKNAVTFFEKTGFSVEWYEKALSNEMLEERIRDVHILGIRSRSQITESLLQKAPRLLGIGAYCIGTNQVDLESAAKRGVPVFNAPFSNTRSVVELALGEIIMLSRNIMDKNNRLHQGIWDKSSQGSSEIRRKKFGIIGYGHIGSQLSILAENLGMEVYFYDTSEVLALGNAKKCISLKELFKISDVISVHVDGRKQNINLIGEKEFGLMKPGVIFLNLSRGYVVDLGAMVKYIKNGKIKGAAIDVFPMEPKGKDETFITPLQNMSNVILTPHIAGSTGEAQRDIASFVTKELINFIDVGSTELSVNFPRITPPPIEKKTHRLLHIHHNVPGILASINAILAHRGANIESQYLKTNEVIGYAITDINKQYDIAMLKELKKIPNTIKLRVLY